MQSNPKMALILTFFNINEWIIFQGLVLENMHALTINECLNHCKQNHQCQFFSYLSAQQDCIIFSLCAEVDEKEEEFRSGHKECDLQTSSKS